MSTTTTPDLSMSSLLNRTRDRLLASGLYLGDSSIVGKLRWVPEGRGHVLVYDPHLEHADANAADTTAELGDQAGVTSQVSDDQTDSPPPKAAKLTVIVRIDREDFWLTSDGGYIEPTAICKEIQEVKPSCALSNPAVEPASSDFPTVLQTLRILTEQCVTPGYSSGKSFFSMEKNKPPRFKVRHRLFERIESAVVGDNQAVEATSSKDDPFSYQLWPLTRERHRAELLALRHSHRLCPVPAYDLANDLLIPSTYRSCLQGAIVEIHFTLSHWGIATTKRDVYSGLIQRICILVPPVASAAAGNKRKLPLHLDTDEPPAKKERAC
ncbi:hypothetical protein PISMIDRAFT_18584 [Pisolithus microcarpus 441]|uniref:Uncharacterized protein n=1 Tax=Pisolithus microcarpus 441 TaxID=765257 RepID=A0A0C9YQM2_9AGAM|nr:hypothetical protein PISMIDRAFT_18584 [Pisolithus microcarpus 441]